MKIFILVGFGHAEVFDASSLEGLQRIYDRIIAALDGHHFDELLSHVDNKLKQKPTERNYEAAINHILKTVKVGQYDVLDYGTGFTELQ